MKAPRLLLTATLLGSSALFGCLTHQPGRPFDTTHEKDLRVGQDVDQVEKWFGPPHFRMGLPGDRCASRWIYYSAPSQLLLIDFDAHAKVCR